MEKKKLREIDRRMRYLTKRLESAVVVDPKQQRGGKVFFGATVELEDEDGHRSTHQIVGEDEIDGAANKISWRSPVGRALLGRSAGDVVTVRRPAGRWSSRSSLSGTDEPERGRVGSAGGRADPDERAGWSARMEEGSA